MTDDRFATDEGGLSALDGTVSDFYFDNGQYGASICLKISFDDPENYPRFPEGVYTQWYPLERPGQDTKFTAVDNGMRLDGPTKWDRRTDAGRLLAALGNVPGIGDAVPGDWDKADANSWKGLHLHWERETYTIKRYRKDANKQHVLDENGDKILEDATMSVMLPKGLLDTQLTISSNGAGHLDVTTLGLSPEQTTILAKAASESTSGAKFIEAVVAYDATLMAGTPLAAAIAKDAEGVRTALAAEII